jgi:hypothetical protein
MLEDGLVQEEPGRRTYVLVGALLVGLLVVVAIVSGGAVLLFHDGSSPSTSPSPSPPPTSVETLPTANELQLCPTKPSGSQLNARGQIIYPIPDLIVADMLANGTWREGCPVPIEDLVLLELPYWNCDQASVERGQMIVHANVSNTVKAVFEELFVAGFPIYKMNLMARYGASDAAAMADNNTSSFCCRAITNKPGTFSLHSYGKAVDVNTLINPYVNGDQVLPPEGAPYVNRSLVVRLCTIQLPMDSLFAQIPGTIIGPGGVCYDAFMAHPGWEWLGSWDDYQDYQHFQFNW